MLQQPWYCERWPRNASLYRVLWQYPNRWRYIWWRIALSIDVAKISYRLTREWITCVPKMQICFLLCFHKGIQEVKDWQDVDVIGNRLWWWCHEMETLFTSLYLCEGNHWSVGFRSQRISGAELVVVNVSPNKHLTKQSICRWFGTPWRTYDVTLIP